MKNAVTSFGMLQIAGAPGLHLRQLVVSAAKANNISAYSGLSETLKSLMNPSQIESTLFEIDVAHWCSTRREHSDLVLNCPVRRGNSCKYPDLLWVTKLGEFFGEAKLSNVFGQDVQLAITRLAPSPRPATMRSARGTKVSELRFSLRRVSSTPQSQLLAL